MKRWQWPEVREVGCSGAGLQISLKMAAAEGKKVLLKHIMLLKFREGVTEEKIDDIFAQWASLQNVIKEIKGLCWGKDVSRENLQQGFTHGVEMLFENEDDVSAYIAHADHVHFLHNVLIPGSEAVVVVDFYPSKA